MWLATTQGWFSVVTDNQRPGRMLVRARCKVDIFNLFNANRDLASIEAPTSDPLRDYRWRLSVSKADWIELALRLADGVNYDNFKSAVAKYPSQQNKSSAYLRIWSELADVQRQENRATERRAEIKPAAKPAKPAPKRKIAKKTKKLF